MDIVWSKLDKQLLNSQQLFSILVANQTSVPVSDN